MAPSTGPQSVVEHFATRFKVMIAGEVPVFLAVEVGRVVLAVIRWATQE